MIGPSTKAICLQFTSSHLVILRSNLMLAQHLIPCLPSGFFLPELNTCMYFSYPHVCHMSPPIIFSEEYKLLSSSLCVFLCSSVTLSLLSPDTLLSILFSNIFNLWNLVPCSEGRTKIKGVWEQSVSAL